MGYDVRISDRWLDYTLCIGNDISIITSNKDSSCVKIYNELFAFNFNYNEELTKLLARTYEFCEYDNMSIILYRPAQFVDPDTENIEKKLKYFLNLFKIDTLKNRIPSIYKIVNCDDKKDFSRPYRVNHPLVDLNTNNIMKTVEENVIYNIDIEINEVYYTLTFIVKGYVEFDFIKRIRTVFVEYIKYKGIDRFDIKFKESIFDRFFSNNKKCFNRLMKDFVVNVKNDELLSRFISEKFNNNIVINIHINEYKGEL